MDLDLVRCLDGSLAAGFITLKNIKENSCASMMSVHIHHFEWEMTIFVRVLSFSRDTSCLCTFLLVSNLQSWKIF